MPTLVAINIRTGCRFLLLSLRAPLLLLIVGIVITVAGGVLTAPKLQFDENGEIIPVTRTGYPLPWLVTWSSGYFCPPPADYCDTSLMNRVDWTLLSLDILLYPLVGYLLWGTYRLVNGRLLGKQQLL